jgi:hypothetical protein
VARPFAGRAGRAGLVVAVVVLGAFVARPSEAGALPFFCPFPFPGGPGFPDANDPGPPNGVNQCSGKVEDEKAPPGPPENSTQDINFDAFLPPEAFDPIGIFSTPPDYGSKITVEPKPSVFPADPMVGEIPPPGDVIFRMLFHLVNPMGSGDPGGQEPDVSYTVSFNLPARLKIAPGAITGLNQNVGGSANRQFTVTNISNDTPVKVDSVALGEAGAAAFKLDGCLGMTLPPQGSCPLTLTFTPASAGAFPVSVTATGNDGSQARVTGSGNGTTPRGGGGKRNEKGGKNAQPCDCSKVDAFVNDFGVYHESTRLTFKLNTTITCTHGTGAGCNGRASLLAPPGMFFVTPPVKGAKGPVRHRTVKVECSGRCAKSTNKTVSFTLLALRVRDTRFLPKGRGAKGAMHMVLHSNCISPTGVLRPPDRRNLKIAFKPNGNVDYKKSDLDGDGKPDGRQLK